MIGASYCVVYSEIGSVRAVKGRQTVVLLALKQDVGEDIKAFVETYRRVLSRQRLTQRKGENSRATPCLWTIVPAINHSNAPSPEWNADALSFVHLMHSNHEDMVGLGANKGLKMHRQTVGLVCHLEAEVFLCPLVDEATRLASAPCSKHNQG